MDCQQIDRGVYLFHALGLTEGDELLELNAHLADHCLSCTEAVQEAATIWYVYGVEGGWDSEFAQMRPSSALRRRILSSVRSKSLWNSLIPTFTTLRYSAGAASLAITAGIGWQLGALRSGEELRTVSQALQSREGVIAQLQNQMETLRASGGAPVPTNPKQPAPAVFTVTIPDPRVSELERLLGELQATDATLQRDFSSEQARATQLDQNLAATTQQLAQARQDLQRAEAARRDADSALASERTQATVQLASVRQRVRQLELQVLEYQQVLDTQQRDARQYQLMAAALQAPNTVLVRLQGTERARNSYGSALVSEGQRVVFFASQLPALPAGRTYQLWLMRRDGPAVVSAGIFRQSAQGVPTVEFSNAALIRGVTGFAVSEEPAGGSPLPTGSKFLVGTVKG